MAEAMKEARSILDMPSGILDDGGREMAWGSAIAYRLDLIKACIWQIRESGNCSLVGPGELSSLCGVLRALDDAADRLEALLG